MGFLCTALYVVKMFLVEWVVEWFMKVFLVEWVVKVVEWVVKVVEWVVKVVEWVVKVVEWVVKLGLDTGFVIVGSAVNVSISSAHSGILALRE